MAKNELVTPLVDSAMDETNDALKAVLARLKQEVPVVCNNSIH